MKVGDPVYRGDQVHLPVEVLALIISYTASFHNHSSQATLWSCCLVSKAWYATSINPLYEHPLLDNRNFDKFARTICPPVSSRKPRVGLENFIKRLDMGGLAYESSKSLTARMLRRTRNSLESFVAPAVTFSIACLAPLAKCTNLHLLNLSSDSYDMSLRQLLDSIGHLDCLTTLKLPRNALRTRCTLQAKSHWPARLSNLQISDWMYDDLDSWVAFFESWPDTMRTLRIQECMGYGSFHCLDPSIMTADTIRSLDIGMSHHDDAFPFRKIFKTFPNLQTLKLPAYEAKQMASWTGVDEYLMNLQTGAHLDVVDSESPLEDLVFTERQPASRPTPLLHVEELERYVHKYPRLRRLEVPAKFVLENDADESDDLGSLTDQLCKRAPSDKKRSSGLYLR